MSTKINVFEEFGIKKPIEVKFTNKNMLKTLQMQRALAKLDVLESEGELTDDYFSEFENMINSVTEYLSELLKLERQKIMDLEFSETMNLLQKVMGAVMQITPVPIEESGAKDLKA